MNKITAAVEAATEADLNRLSLPLALGKEALVADEALLVEGYTAIAVKEHSSDTEAKAMALVTEHYRRGYTVVLTARSVKLPNGNTIVPVPVPDTLAGDVADLGGSSKAYGDAIRGVWDNVEAAVTRHLRKEEGFSARAAKAEAKGYVSKARDRVGYYFRLNMEESALTADELWAYGFNRSSKLGKDQKLQSFPPLGGNVPKASPAVQALTKANTELSAKEKGGNLTDPASLLDVLSNLLVIARTAKATRPMPTAKTQADRARSMVKELGLVLSTIVTPASK